MASFFDSVRNDVGLLWLQNYLESVTFGTTLKTLMRKRGWLKGRHITILQVHHDNKNQLKL